MSDLSGQRWKPTFFGTHARLGDSPATIRCDEWAAGPGTVSLTVPGTLSSLLALVALVPCPPANAFTFQFTLQFSMHPQSPLSRRAPHRAEQSVETALAPGTAYLLASSTAGTGTTKPEPCTSLVLHSLPSAHSSQERTTCALTTTDSAAQRRVRFLDGDGVTRRSAFE